MLRRLAAALGALTIYVTIPIVTTIAQQPAGPSVAGEVLVKYRASASVGRRNGILNGRAAVLLRRSRALDVDHIRLPPGQNFVTALAALRSTPDVLLVQPNFIRRTTASSPPNDLYWTLGFMWGMERIQAQPAWAELTTGDANVVVADIDTGVDYTHPDLAQNMWKNPDEVAGNGVDDDGNGYVDDVFGIDAVNDDSDPMDDNGHGTHTAGTIGARGNNSAGVVGVAWETSILACKFLDAQGNGTDADAIECFDYILALKRHGVGIRVTNNSWGAPRESQIAAVLKDAIDTAGAAGILNVFSAGNAGTNNDASPLDPASFDSPSIISVAASAETDGRASFSNYGLTSVDIAAPGSSILSTYQGNYAFANGSSMAAPHVSGAAALIASRNPNVSMDSMKSLLMQGADVVPQWAGLSVTSGILNVFNAVAPSGGNNLPSVAVTSPANGASFMRSATISVQATATDSDGTISQVTFFANGLAIGTDASGPSPYTAPWTPVLAGTYVLTAVATDDLGATRQSVPVTITVSPPAGRANVALAVNGGLATGSSARNGYPASGVNNGDRRGLSWGSGGGWNDDTNGVWPDSLVVDFATPQSIEEVDVFTLQNSYNSPAEPTPSMTFTQYGVVDFKVEFWTGTEWQLIPGANVTANTLVWRQFHFAPVTTLRMRVNVISGRAGYSRLTEVEAYAVLGSFNSPPNVSITSPAGSTSFDVAATVSLAASASDPDGSVASVNFFANNVLIGPGTPGGDGWYTHSWSTSTLGSYAITAVAVDNLGASRTSTPVNVSVTPPANRVNVAAASNGGVATASSVTSASYPVASVNNGDRRGLKWANGGGWNDGTRNVWPDWVEIQLNGTQMVEEIDVFTLQDNYSNPVEPTVATTFASYGIVDFRVEYWTNGSWEAVPGGVVTGNNKVWRQFFFAPVATSRIRVLVTNGKSSSSRLTEVEAFAVPGTLDHPPSVSLTSPAGGTTYAAPAIVPLAATATDTDGTVTGVDFYANGTLVGAGNGADTLFTFDWQASVPGTYALTAVATDNSGATKTSTPVTITVTAPPGRVNVALQSAGSTASASSTLNSSYPAAGAINGDRKGVSWGNGGGWNDNTSNVWPDWLEIQFTGARTIEEIDVFSVQDNYISPVVPTLALTFSRYGIKDFSVEYWTGSAWQAVPDGVVTGNTKVWRQFMFAPITTSRIRIQVSNSLGNYSRLAEVEAWGQP